MLTNPTVVNSAKAPITRALTHKRVKSRPKRTIMHPLASKNRLNDALLPTDAKLGIFIPPKTNALYTIQAFRFSSKFNLLDPNRLNKEIIKFSNDIKEIDEKNIFLDSKSKLLFFNAKYPSFFVKRDVFNDGSVIAPIFISPYPICKKNEELPHLMHPDIESINDEVCDVLKDIGIIKEGDSKFECNKFPHLIGLANATDTFIKNRDKMVVLALLLPSTFIIDDKNERIEDPDEAKEYHKSLIKIFTEKELYKSVLDDNSYPKEFKLWAEIKRRLVSIYDENEDKLLVDIKTLADSFQEEFSSTLFENLMNRKELIFTNFVNYRNYMSLRKFFIGLQPMLDATNLLLGIPEFKNRADIKPEISRLSEFSADSVSQVNEVVSTLKEIDPEKKLDRKTFSKRADEINESHPLNRMNGVVSTSYEKKLIFEECFYEEAYNHIKSCLNMFQCYANLIEINSLSTEEQEAIETTLRWAVIANPIWHNTLTLRYNNKEEPGSIEDFKKETPLFEKYFKES